MSKPIWETHPSFAKVWADSVGMPLDGADLKEAVQRTTVDVAKHERLKLWWTERFNLERTARRKLDAEVERLKQEVEHYKSELAHANVEYGEIIERLKKELSDYKENAAFRLRGEVADALMKGETEGERRATEKAIERVKEAFLFVANDKLGEEISECKELCLLWDELGLGEEEKR